MNTWQLHILKGITFSLILVIAGLASLFVEPTGLFATTASIAGGGALIGAPIVLMRYLRKIL